MPWDGKIIKAMIKVHTLTAQTWQFSNLDAAVEAFDLNLNATKVTGKQPKERKHTQIGTVDLKGAGHITVYWCHDECIVIDSLGNNLYDMYNSLPVDTVTIHGESTLPWQFPNGKLELRTGINLDGVLSKINGRKTGNIYIAKGGSTSDIFNQPIKLA